MNTAAPRFIVLALLLGPRPASSTVIHVYPDGSGDAPTIAAAYAMANIGDDIVLGPGTYYEHDILMESGVDLLGASGEPSDTIVDAQGLGRCLGGNVSGAPVIEAVTFQNGWHAVEGGILLAGQGGTGGGHNARYRRCVFRGGSAPRGGGVVSHATSGVSASFTDCIFEDNHATAGDGGAVWAVSGQATTSTFRQNTATGNGGAVYTEKLVDWGLSAEDCVFEENSAAGDGGAYFSTGYSAFYGTWIFGCTFTGNSAANGGAACLAGYDLVRRSRFLDNSVTGEGGALVLVDIRPDDDFYGEYEGNLFARNHAAMRGGAVAVHGLSTIMHWFHGTFVMNDAPSGGHFWADGAPTVSACIFAFATSGGSCAGTVAVPSGCTDVFGNAGGDFVGPLAGGGGVPTNFSADPRFCNSAASDWSLQEGSPCLPPLPPGCGSVPIGALGLGCGAVSVDPSSWSRIKASYR